MNIPKKSIETQTNMTLMKEPHASLANQLELSTPVSKMIMPIHSRNDTLNDNASQ